MESKGGSHYTHSARADSPPPRNTFTASHAKNPAALLVPAKVEAPPATLARSERAADLKAVKVTAITVMKISRAVVRWARRRIVV